MTPLRQKMEADLRLRNLAPTTGACYIGHVARYARYFGRCPSQLGTDEVRSFLLDLKDQGLAPATLVVYHAALRFVYGETLGRPEVMATVPRPRVRSTPPRRPLVREEVAALLAASAASPWTYTVIATLLATGLRVSEVCDLKPSDVDARAGLLHVRRGKGSRGCGW
jgi:integrase